MNPDIPMPHITGKTPTEQLAQIISYLRQLALVLQELPLADGQRSQEDLH